MAISMRASGHGHQAVVDPCGFGMADASQMGVNDEAHFAGVEVSRAHYAFLSPANDSVDGFDGRFSIVGEDPFAVDLGGCFHTVGVGETNDILPSGDVGHASLIDDAVAVGVLRNDSRQFLKHIIGPLTSQVQLPRIG